jgi:hypothetical protein
MEASALVGVSNVKATKPIAVDTSKYNEINKMAYRRHTSSTHLSGVSLYQSLRILFSTVKSRIGSSA